MSNCFVYRVIFEDFETGFTTTKSFNDWDKAVVFAENLYDTNFGSVRIFKYFDFKEASSCE